MSKAVVLFSGGQDSTTCLYWARTYYDEVEAVSVHYGQRHSAELAAARTIAKMAEVEHRVLEMPVLYTIADSALVAGMDEIKPSGGYADKEMPEGLPTSFVPARNALLLTVATAVAVKLGARDVVTGVCQTDYSGYPDCRRPFVDALEHALTEGLPSSCGPIRLQTPLMDLTKAETVRLAHRLPGCWDALGYSVTCYEGQRPGCGRCPACELRAQGFTSAGLDDPATVPS